MARIDTPQRTAWRNLATVVRRVALAFVGFLVIGNLVILGLHGVARAEVGRSIVMRRFHARGRGRAARVEKWFSHLKIVVAERAQDEGETA